MEETMSKITKPAGMSKEAWNRARAEVAWLAIPGNTIGGAVAAVVVPETVVVELPNTAE